MVTNAIAPVLRSIPADQIDPNPWNPNRMVDERFEEYVAEVRRLKRLPKPVVVRQLEDRYQNRRRRTRLACRPRGWLCRGLVRSRRSERIYRSA